MNLELVSGMGLHLCLLATAYPEGSFVGVDFHVDQIAHSLQFHQQLGLTNLRFLQADFLHLAEALAAGRPVDELQPRSFGYNMAFNTSPRRNTASAIRLTRYTEGDVLNLQRREFPVVEDVHASSTLLPAGPQP